MTGSERVTNPDQAAKRVLELLDHVRKEGRRVLVVVGAGCSYAAHMPLMSDVYKYLHDRLVEYQGTDNHLRTLRDWLAVLKIDGGPRSLAAQALGLFQQPQLIIATKPRSLLEQTWKQFASDFLNWKVGSKGKPPDVVEPTILGAKPTTFHTNIAAWVKAGRATVLSLNFDGLTRKAIEQASTPKQDERCVILARREEIDRYFFGQQDAHISGESSRLWAVIKARGDVFHATCRNPLCPACERPTAIYDLQRQYDLKRQVEQAQGERLPGPRGKHVGPAAAAPASRDTSQPSQESEAPVILRCPECGAPRQLEISFTGYQRKEEEAEDVLDGLRECVMPAIGGIITVGVSGLWDDALVELVKKAGQAWKDEDARTADNAPVPRILCVDRRQDAKIGEPFLVQCLGEAGIPLVLAATGAEELANVLTIPATEPISDEFEDHDFQPPFTSGMKIRWADRVLNPVMAPPPLNESPALRDHTVSERFGKLRQLGLKTALVRLPKMTGGWEEKSHNRLVHSAGAALIALTWIRRLLEDQQNRKILAALPFPPAVLKSAAFLACLTHDLSHLPFTHLTEEVFAELHWTTSPWAKEFHHDSDVLDICDHKLRKWARGTIDEVQGKLGLPKDASVLRVLVGRAIEGRSGIPLLDGVINSPIDADKLEYVVSDCVWMEQDVHLPILEKGDEYSRLRSWLDTFFAGQHILPSGVIAISGTAADNAYRLLEERRWLYKHLYFRPPFRVIERLVHHLLVRWLTWQVGQELANELSSGRADALEHWSRDGGIANASLPFDGPIPLGDARCIKGRKAAEFLWNKLTGAGHEAGEPKLARDMAEELSAWHKGTSLEDWYTDCASLLKRFLEPADKPEFDTFDVALGKKASWSSRMYIRRSDFDKAREIVRRLEYGSGPSALIDLAPLPPMLSYPSARRFPRGNRRLHADCWAVPHKDPERWGKQWGRWVPLGKTALARQDREENRWVQILVVSPRPDDRPALQYLEDRFRSACANDGIRIFDEEPPVIDDGRDQDD